MHFNSILHNSISVISLKTYALAGIEPGSAVPQAETMSTVPRRQGNLGDCLPWAFLFENYISYYISSPNYRATFSQKNLCCKYDKM
jgi:hypothetical protein